VPQSELVIRVNPGVNPTGNPNIKSTMPARGARDGHDVQTSRRGEKWVRTDDALPHIVPTVLSVATGGAVIGGIFFGMPGAVVGSVAGALLGAVARRRNGAS